MLFLIVPHLTTNVQGIYEARDKRHLVYKFNRIRQIGESFRHRPFVPV